MRKVNLGAVNAGLSRLLPPTDGVQRDGNQDSIDTVILQTFSDVWLTIAIHVTAGREDTVRIPIFVPAVKDPGYINNNLPIYPRIL